MLHQIYEEAEDEYSSTDDYTDDEQYDRTNYPDHEVEVMHVISATRSNSTLEPFSLTTIANDDLEDRHFSIFNNKEERGKDQSGKLDVKDLKKTRSEHQTWMDKEAYNSKDEAVSSQVLRVWKPTQDKSTLDNGETKDSGLFRRRESEEARGREKYGSRRRTLTNTSPNNISKEGDRLNSEKVGSKDQVSSKQCLKVNDDQETNGSRVPRGSNAMDRANQAKDKSKRTKPYTRIEIENPSHNEFQTDDLGMTRTANQRTEALGRVETHTRRYEDNLTLASVMSKTKEQASQKRTSPNKNSIGSDTPSSASGGQNKDNYTAKHQKERQSGQEGLHNSYSVEDLEEEAMKDYNKLVTKMIQISKKKSATLDRKEGTGEQRTNVLSTMAATKTLSVVVELGKQHVKSLNISKMDILTTLLTSLKYQVDMALESNRDMGEEPISSIGEAIYLVNNTLSLTVKMYDVLILLYDEEARKLIDQHEGVLKELEMIRDRKQFKRVWMPTDPREVQAVFQWYWGHRAMLMEFEVQFTTLQDVGGFLRRYDSQNIIKSRMVEEERKARLKPNFYDDFASQMDQYSVGDEEEEGSLDHSNHCQSKGKDHWLKKMKLNIIRKAI